MKYVIKHWIVGLLFVLLAGCTTGHVGPDIVAHRGASQDGPENTIAAFNLAWQQEADAIEGDFYLTADKQIVCIHDKTTKRVAKVNLDVAKSTYDQLSKLDVGSWKDPRFSDQTIPTLAQVLMTVPSDKYILIEIKCGPEIVPFLAKTLATTDIKPKQVRVIAFNTKVVAEVKKKLPHIKVYWLTSFKQDKKTGQWSPTVDKIITTLKQTKADGLDCQAKLEVLTDEFVQRIRTEGFELHAWTVNDPVVAQQLKDLGLDSITTDQPKLIREQLH